MTGIYGSVQFNLVYCSMVQCSMGGADTVNNHSIFGTKYKKISGLFVNSICLHSCFEEMTNRQINRRVGKLAQYDSRIDLCVNIASAVLISSDFLKSSSFAQSKSSDWELKASCKHMLRLSMLLLLCREEYLCTKAATILCLIKIHLNLPHPSLFATLNSTHSTIFWDSCCQ